MGGVMQIELGTHKTGDQIPMMLGDHIKEHEYECR